MPAYEYVCADCRRDFIIFLTLKEYEAKPEIKCPHCGSKHVERKITSFFARTSKKS